MIFEAYKISENNYQLFNIKGNQRMWLASFNKIQTLLDYYIYCHNLSNDMISFTGVLLNDDEAQYYSTTKIEWRIRDNNEGLV